MTSLQIGAVFLWSIVYNIVRIMSNATEGDGGAQTNQIKVLVSGSATEAIAEDNCSALNDHTDECTLPLISTDIPPTKNKVFSLLKEHCTRSPTAVYALQFGLLEALRFNLCRFQC